MFFFVFITQMLQFLKLLSNYCFHSSFKCKDTKENFGIKKQQTNKKTQF